MKIGIVTFWTSNGNYGQLLQCWALQQQLIKMGHEPFLIRFKRGIIKSNPIKRFIKAVLIFPILKKLLNAYQANRIAKNNQLRQFDDFRKVYIKQSDLLYTSIGELRANPPLADLYMTGSDQGWAQLINKEDNKVYFLDFGDSSIKRISYAPSFAMEEYPESLKPELKQLLAKYSKISVREKSGVRICNDLGLKAEHVLDPTLLLKKEDYIKLLNLKHNDSNTLFVYALNLKSKEDLRWDELKQFSQRKGMRTVVTIGEGITPAKELFGDHVCYDYCTIQKWLENILNAKLVVTSSFHGIVFSILMETPFVFVPFKGERMRFNDRILDLLNALGLEGRMLNEDRCYESLISKTINWNEVRERLEIKRKDSIDFLQENIS